MTKPARLRLRLLGRFALLRDDESTIRLSTRKAGGLLAYLAMNPEQTASREELATLLWGSFSEQQARQSLRQALALLRKELGSPHPFTADARVVRLQPGAWSADVLEFEAFTKAPTAEGLERAVDLFGGEFLTGINLDEEVFDEWLLVQRQRAQLTAARLCEIFVEQPELVRDGQQAVVAIERLMALDPLRESWQRLALVLYARYRGRNEALARADTFRAALRRELDVAPEKETRALIERIRSGEVPPVSIERQAIEPHNPAPRPESAPPVAGLSVAGETKAERPAAAGVHPPRFSAWRARAASGIAAAAALGLIVGLVALGVPDRLQGSVGRNAAAPVPDPWHPPGPLLQSASSVGRSGGIVALAVLPFTVARDGGEPLHVIAEVMTDDLTNTLSRLPGVRVISRHSSASYKGQPIDAAAVGAELGVPYLLVGDVDAAGSRLRVNVELVDTRSRLKMWSSRYERTGADRDIIQDDIAKGIGRELQIEVTRIQSAETPGEPDLHHLIIRGWNALAASGRSGLEALREAESYFTRALERDPANPRALTGLGAFHTLMAVQLFAADPAPHLHKAEAILQGVTSRHPSAGEAHAFTGLLNIARGRTEAAVASFERAIELDPSHAPSYAQLGRLMTRSGRAEEGLRHILYAMRLSPRDPGMAFWLGFAGAAELELGNYDKAIDYLDRAIVLHPTQARNLLVRVAAHALAGNTDAARSRIKEVQKKFPHLTGDKLIERFFGSGVDGSGWLRLREGLRLALGLSSDPWQPPPLPSATSRYPTGSAGKAIIPIAVLPFTGYGEDAGSIQLTADIVTDDLINMLSRAQSIRVIARQSTRGYLGKPIDIAAVGAELHVKYVLDGTIRMHGDKLRVNVELIDAATRLPVWSTRIDRDRGERSAVPDEIVGRLARELHFEMFAIESERRSADYDTDTLIYRGWAAIFAHGTAGHDALRQAEQSFTQALERDPESKSARSGLGAYHALVGSLQLDAHSDAHLTKAEDILGKMIREGFNRGSQYFYLGIVHRMRGRMDEAIAAYARALEINPSMAPAHAHIGHSLLWRGRAGEAIEHIRYALKLSPRDATRSHWLRFAGEAELELGHYQEAVDYLQQSYALNPRIPYTVRALAAAHALAGRMQEAQKYYAELKALMSHRTGDMVLRRPVAVEIAQAELTRGLRLLKSDPIGN